MPVELITVRHLYIVEHDIANNQVLARTLELQGDQELWCGRSRTAMTRRLPEVSKSNSWVTGPSILRYMAISPHRFSDADVYYY